RGESLLPRGERAEPGRDDSPRRGAGRLSPDRTPPRPPGTRHGPGDPGGPDRSAATRGQGPAPDGRRDRTGRPRTVAPGARRAAGARCPPGSRAPPGRGVSLRDPPLPRG